MSRFLIVYGTNEGHTAKIADRMATAIRQDGHEVVVHDARAVRETRISNEYDGVLIGGSIHVGEHQSSVREFVKLNRDQLERVPSAFFSVSLTAAEADDEARGETTAMIEKFTRETGWQPGRVEAIAGALVYSQYNVFIRHLMKLIAARSGQPTDTSHDYDFTDWDRVAAFSREFAAGIGVVSA